VLGLEKKRMETWLEDAPNPMTIASDVEVENFIFDHMGAVDFLSWLGI
jgi:uncharacterized protein YqcC (DUF446 family)